MRKLVYGQLAALILLVLLMSGCGGLTAVADPVIIPAANDTAVSQPTLANNPPTPLTDTTPPIDDSLVNLLAQEQAFINVYDQVNPATQQPLFGRRVETHIKDLL